MMSDSIRVSPCFLALIRVFPLVSAFIFSASVVVASDYEAAIRQLEEQGITFDRKLAELRALKAFLSVADPSASILSPASKKKAEARQAGQYFGLGLRLAYTNKTAQIVETKQLNPFFNIGDRILEINGEKLVGIRFSHIFTKLREEVATNIALKIERIDGQVDEVNALATLQQANPIELVENLPHAIGYIKINGLYQGGGGEIAAAIRTWNQEKYFGVIMDLRDANGQDLNAVVDMASLYAKKDDVLFQIKDRKGNVIKEYKAKGEGPINLPTMVLINEHTSGAAEVLAAALAGSGLGAMIFGEMSSGEMGLREFIPLPGGDFMYVATKTIMFSGGEAYKGTRGIKPDVWVDDVDMAESLGITSTDKKNKTMDVSMRAALELKKRISRDAIFQRAVDVLLGLKALNIKIFELGASASH